jgi:hypothetical protein
MLVVTTSQFPGIPTKPILHLIAILALMRLLFRSTLQSSIFVGAIIFARFFFRPVTLGAQHSAAIIDISIVAELERPMSVAGDRERAVAAQLHRDSRVSRAHLYRRFARSCCRLHCFQQQAGTSLHAFLLLCLMLLQLFRSSARRCR